jgi:hypothetical protein
MPKMTAFTDLIKQETDEALSMAAFSAGLLEQVIIAAGTTKLSAGVQKGRYTIRLANVKFTGADATEAFQKLFYWLATKPAAALISEYARRGELVEQQEKADTDGVIELLAEGGMTAFGQQVQEYRKQREGAVLQSLRELKSEGELPTDLSVLHEKMMAKTGLDDLTMQELLLALGNDSRVATPVTS